MNKYFFEDLGVGKEKRFLRGPADPFAYHDVHKLRQAACQYGARHGVTLTVKKISSHEIMVRRIA